MARPGRRPWGRDLEGVAASLRQDTERHRVLADEGFSLYRGIPARSWLLEAQHSACTAIPEAEPCDMQLTLLRGARLTTLRNGIGGAIRRLSISSIMANVRRELTASNAPHKPRETVWALYTRHVSLQRQAGCFVLGINVEGNNYNLADERWAVTSAILEAGGSYDEKQQAWIADQVKPSVHNRIHLATIPGETSPERRHNIIDEAQVMFGAMARGVELAPVSVTMPGETQSRFL